MCNCPPITPDEIDAMHHKLEVMFFYTSMVAFIIPSLLLHIHVYRKRGRFPIPYYQENFKSDRLKEHIFSYIMTSYTMLLLIILVPLIRWIIK